MLTIIYMINRTIKTTELVLRPRYLTSHFSEADYSKSEKYVLETLRSRSWIDYMISSYLPK